MITPRQAREWKKRALQAEEELKNRHIRWNGDMPSWTAIRRITLGVDHPAMVAIKTSRKLNHAVVCVPQENDLVFFAYDIAIKGEHEK